MKKIEYLLGLLLLFATFSCKDEVELIDMDFSGELEQPVSEDSTKNYLAMERYVYWNANDTVYVFSGSSGYQDYVSKREALATPIDNGQRASISLPGFAYSDEYYGIYPASRHGDGPNTINMPTAYSYTRDANATIPVDADLTFPGPGIPMVAYHKVGNTSSSDVPNLEFHSLVGLSRIEIANNDASQEIEKVVFTECGSSHNMTTKPISGAFSISDITKYNPYVTTTSSTSGTQIAINNINKTLNKGDILTLYLPLPATTSNNNTSSNRPNYTEYALNMKVYSSESTVVFEKDFAVKIRRNTLSFLPAIVVNSWTSASLSLGMVGDGTQLRPFQIYNEDDMLKVKVAFDMATPTINGKKIDNNTYFRVVRSDITLSAAKWTGGIKNFMGHFTYQSGSATSAGIANNSTKPIFQSVSEGAVVEGLYVKGTPSPTGTVFSPLCETNNGTLSSCRCAATVTSSSSNLAGVCVTNTSKGIIINCSNTGLVSATGYGSSAAGICYDNYGTIQGYDISSANVSAQQSAANLCYYNHTGGVVENSQVYLNYGSSASTISYKLGGLVYLNEGTIQNCEVLGMVFSSAELGGICHTNKGLVDYCRIGTRILQGSGYVGGIAAQQTGITSAEIRNCYNTSEPTTNIRTTSGYCGGIVAYLGSGKLYNCFTNFEVAYLGQNDHGMIVGQALGGDVQNCYSGKDLAPFYAEANQTRIAANCFNTDPLTYCCRYNYSTGAIISRTSESTNYATVGTQLHVALNAWAASKNGATGTTYKYWTADVHPQFSNTNPDATPSTKAYRR